MSLNGLYFSHGRHGKHGKLLRAKAPLARKLLVMEDTQVSKALFRTTRNCKRSFWFIFRAFRG
jgi:hypothetical protein